LGLCFELRVLVGWEPACPGSFLMDFWLENAWLATFIAKLRWVDLCCPVIASLCRPAPARLCELDLSGVCICP
jgi:hypothetical protein